MKTMKSAVLTVLAVFTFMLTLSAPVTANEADKGDRALFVGLAATAGMTMGDAVAPAIVVLSMLHNSNTYAADCPKDDYNAPLVKAAHRSNPEGYHFVTTTCDFKLNQDRYVKVK